MGSRSDPPRRYQSEGTAWLEGVERGLLADEPGLGKSRQLLDASVGETLIIAPAGVLNGGNWDDEIGSWCDGSDRFAQSAYSSLNQRERTGRGSGSRPIAALAPAVDQRWDTLILDESHYIKNRGTSWTGAVEKIASRSDRVFMATGTPLPNWPHEIYTHLRILFPEEARPGRRFGSYWRWIEEWFTVTPSRFSQGRDIGDLQACRAVCWNRPAWDPCEHYQAFTVANFGDRFLRRLRDDVLTDLPPLTETTVETPLAPSDLAAYRRLKKDAVAILADGAEVVAWSTGAKHVLLDRMTTSPWLLDPQGPPKGGKFERLRADLQNRARPTLVVAHYQDTVNGCAEVARSLGAKTVAVHGGFSQSANGESIKQFKRGEIDVMVGSLEMVAEGHTLTAADQVIFVEKSYKPSRNTQALRRIHRLGQVRPVSALDYVTPHTVDAHKRLLLATKNDRQMRTMTSASMAKIL